MNRPSAPDRPPTLPNSAFQWPAASAAAIPPRKPSNEDDENKLPQGSEGLDDDVKGSGDELREEEEQEEEEGEEEEQQVNWRHAGQGVGHLKVCSPSAALCSWKQTELSRAR